MDLGRDVPDAVLHAHLHDQLAARTEGGDVQLGIHDLGAHRDVEVAGGDGTGTLLAEREGDRVVVVELHDELLEVEDDLHHVFGDALDGRELVEHVLYVDARDGGTGDRREQHAPERVAQRDAVAAR